MFVEHEKVYMWTDSILKTYISCWENLQIHSYSINFQTYFFFSKFSAHFWTFNLKHDQMFSVFNTFLYPIKVNKNSIAQTKYKKRIVLFKVFFCKNILHRNKFQNSFYYQNKNLKKMCVFQKRSSFFNVEILEENNIFIKESSQGNNVYIPYLLTWSLWKTSLPRYEKGLGKYLTLI